MERKQRENELLAMPDEVPSGEVARLPKGAFKEDSFHGGFSNVLCGMMREGDLSRGLLSTGESRMGWVGSIG